MSMTLLNSRASSGGMASSTGRGAPRFEAGCFCNPAGGSGLRTRQAVRQATTTTDRPVVPAAPVVTVAPVVVPVVVIDYRVSLFDALKFNGPAPELINGRLAMLGFLLGASREAHTGETLVTQLSHLSVGTCLIAAVWIYASMVPILAGAKNEAFGFFSPRAEMVNGRAAMLGFAALLALEYHVGVPFF